MCLLPQDATLLNLTAGKVGGGEEEDGGLKELSSALHALVDEDAKDSTLSKQGIVTLLQ